MAVRLRVRASNLGDDGDPLDILVMLSEPTFSGCMIKARVLGAFRIRKNGVENDRFIAAPVPMPGVTLETDAFETMGDIDPARCEEIELQ
jgi:inorganic pyrophosphatase